MISALEPFVGSNIAAAVVPMWHGVPVDRHDGFTTWIVGQFGEILLHGLTHRRETGNGFVSYFTNRSDEFSGLTDLETSRRLNSGQKLLTNLIGRPVSGFVPPAWQCGRVDSQALSVSGLQYLLGYFSLDPVVGQQIPITTLTWDVGRIASLGIGAEILGRTLYRFRRPSVRCLALHPVDVTRGYLPRIVRLVRAWIQSENVPVLPGVLSSAPYQTS